MGIRGSMAQAQPNPQVNAMCANIAARLYPLGIQTMPNVQAAHEEIQQITTTLGDLSHGVKRMISDFLDQPRDSEFYARWLSCLSGARF